MSLVKVFLGGYINFTNAQNLNCKALAQHLDKEIFTVYTLELYNGESVTANKKGIHIYRCFRPHRISIYLGYLWGIWHCDLAYLPKGEIWRFNRFLLRLFRKRSFSTIEGIWDEKNLQSALEHNASIGNLVQSFSFFDEIFAITAFVRKYNFDKHGLICANKILYLGTENERFMKVRQPKQPLQTVIYIGRLMERKGIYDFLQIVDRFPELEFLIAGDGPEKANIVQYIAEHNLENARILGVLQHEKLAELLVNVQLHVLPSRSEGFPKVILETASAGIPSIVYGDYGANEWIVEDTNGWVVNTVGEIENIMKKLQEKPEILYQVSEDAVLLAKSFDWKIKVKDWEEVMLNLIQKQYK
jgi:glycosyltransferase involved in cell wall biosynthesis